VGRVGTGLFADVCWKGEERSKEGVGFQQYTQAERERAFERLTRV
jgi:hypothetical protein